MIVSETNGNGNSNGMVMPVGPLSGGYGNGGGFGWGDNGGVWMWLVFLIALMGGGFGNWGNGFGGGGGFGGAIPFMMGNNYTNADVQRGFDQSAIMNSLTGINSAVTSGFSGVNTNLCNGFANIQQSLCNGFAGVNQGVANGFAQAEIANNGRQMANMQQAFTSQTAITSGLTGLSQQFAQCCCDNRLATESLRATILQENCQDRYEAANNTRDIITNNTANTQALLNSINNGIQGIQDKLCQQELDAERRENQNLRSQLAMKDLAASQTAQTAAILANNQAQTAALEQYLNPAPIPAYVVQNPNCCGNNYNGCCNG